MNIEEIKKIITRYYRTLNYREDINFNGSLLLFFISYFDNKEEKYKYIKVYTDIKRYTVEIINEKESLKILNYSTIENYYKFIKNISINFFINFLREELEIEIIIEDEFNIDDTISLKNERKKEWENLK
ncbi:hypothetical protein ACO1GV_01620 [Fusobacterium watanabei]|jgi:hypothetical protein|uniref:Uncharacterized protein n=1 Tax=Fusobacterium animalis 7_1 TaxID=457405 RepID=A0A140PSZ5_9FUSO|nr:MULTISPECIES: hypothetical protein [Fusobacterium]EEO42918.1 hypothetical protein FSDG_01477 [Fusobacterium animalis 7_1]EPC08374.1 hypothetical protein HMPREF9369_03177 [Fusobacterium polymorphum F0401]